jgi:hypothetical protein
MNNLRKKSVPGTVVILTIVDAHTEQTALKKACSDMKHNHSSNVDDKKK